ncbi:MAG TPA: substrate-binding domain-containing protein [Polyangiaceae bacterium]|jgi:LacI family transcriptional regulator
MDAPRVLVVMGTNAGWSRGILRGFMAAAHERAWTPLHYHPDANLRWLVDEWRPDAAVFGPEFGADGSDQLDPTAVVSVTVDRTAQGISSVCIDETAIAKLAADHLLATGLRNVSTFRFDQWGFALARERAFIAFARAAGAHVAPGWGDESVSRPEDRHEQPAAIVAWLRALPKPCGIFTLTDAWARTVARCARIAGCRIPEDLALLGVDNDALECELISPSLSSVVVPWREVGEHAADLIQRALARKSSKPERIVVSPPTVMARRSTDVLAVDDELVAKAVTFIRAHAERRLTVGAVVSAVGSGRQRLERGFRRVLARTIQQEIRRAHVELAKHLLETTPGDLNQVAASSGFSNATLLNLAFQRELGMAPGAYRRRIRQALGASDD